MVVRYADFLLTAVTSFIYVVKLRPDNGKHSKNGYQDASLLCAVQASIALCFQDHMVVTFLTRKHLHLRDVATI